MKEMVANALKLQATRVTRLQTGPTNRPTALVSALICWGAHTTIKFSHSQTAATQERQCEIDNTRMIAQHPNTQIARAIQNPQVKPSLTPVKWPI